MQKLSSGYRINKAADDAAGLAISEKLSRPGQRPRPGPAQRPGRRLARADGRRLDGRGAVDAAARPRPRGRSTTTARCRRTDRPRSRPRSPSSAPRSSSIGTETTFNGIALLTGNATITFQVGANDGETIATSAVKLFGSGSGFAIDSSIFNFSGSTINLASIDAAIQNVSDRSGHVRRRPEPAPAHAEQPGQLPGEPVGARSRRSRTSTWRRRWSTSRSCRCSSRPA